MDPHDIFNKKILDFSEDLQMLATCLKLDIPQMSQMKPLIMMAMAMDITKPRALFNEHVSQKYGKQIMAKDENFFLNESYEQDTEGAGLDIVKMIKSVWGTLNPSNKSAIWQHLQVLMVLDGRCGAKQQ
jgi:hypothetical protein